MIATFNRRASRSTSAALCLESAASSLLFLRLARSSCSSRLAVSSSSFSRCLARSASLEASSTDAWSAAICPWTVRIAWRNSSTSRSSLAAESRDCSMAWNMNSHSSRCSSTSKSNASRRCSSSWSASTVATSSFSKPRCSSISRRRGARRSMRPVMVSLKRATWRESSLASASNVAAASLSREASADSSCKVKRCSAACSSA
mmetsp:Transcript_21821/g.62710  ORF Transcript_21821/g.62710 Transcript_21821/m.62710 type:complete len:203 (-) Transcript_21821:15-623(-)